MSPMYLVALVLLYLCNIVVVYKRVDKTYYFDAHLAVWIVVIIKIIWTILFAFLLTAFELFVIYTLFENNRVWR